MHQRLNLSLKEQVQLNNDGSYLLQNVTQTCVQSYTPYPVNGHVFQFASLQLRCWSSSYSDINLKPQPQAEITLMANSGGYVIKLKTNSPRAHILQVFSHVKYFKPQ